MSSTKVRRDRLFKHSKPTLRPYADSDFWVLWAAYDLGSFPGLAAGATKDQFRNYLDLIRGSAGCLVAEDDCKWFKDKRGPVAFITLKSDGWQTHPAVDFFKWTTPRRKLRVLVAALQKARWSKEIGVIVIRSLQGSQRMLEVVNEYGHLVTPVGTIPEGTPTGDEFLYYLRGQRKAG